MEFSFQIDILGLILKGLLIGVIASAPMGPVGILCIQRTLNKGRWYGFITGVGAALSDLIYAMITGLGMSFVMRLITDPTNKFWLQIIGSVLLLVFGVYCLRSNPTNNIRIGGRKGKGTLLHNGVTAFLVTFSNPLIIFLFMATFAQFAFVIPNRPME
ncbi:MAG: LysE family transporter, partial [Prevotella sp.]|nr:LysE family transporter [Prevotella sp.]